MLILVLAGVLFVVMGNYLPKAKQSYTLGIKIAWTLNSEENWNRPHRLAGWIWMISGLLMIADAFLKWTWVYVIANIIRLFFV